MTESLGFFDVLKNKRTAGALRNAVRPCARVLCNLIYRTEIG